VLQKERRGSLSIGKVKNKLPRPVNKSSSIRERFLKIRASRQNENSLNYLLKKDKNKIDKQNNMKITKINFFQKINNVRKIKERPKSRKETIFQMHSLFKKKYLLIQLLGKGSNSSVYLCKNKFTGVFYAVKVISKNKLKTERHLKNFKVIDTIFLIDRMR
jgi:hypothetical protein